MAYYSRYSVRYPIPQVGAISYDGPRARNLPDNIRFAVLAPFQDGPERWESAHVHECAEQETDFPNIRQRVGTTYCARDAEGYWKPRYLLDDPEDADEEQGEDDTP